jgi:hypothetical protein
MRQSDTSQIQNFYPNKHSQTLRFTAKFPIARPTFLTRGN